MKKATILVLTALAVSLIPVSATEPVIQMQVPTEVTEGDEVTVEITVTHRMNDKNHHISYIWLYQDDRIVEQWGYGADSFVTEDQWTVTYTTVLTKDAVFLAVAHCTLHGDGKVLRTVTVNPYVELPKAVLVANPIDYTRAKSLVTFLEDNGYEVINIAASELSQYQTENLIIILGGADALEGVGDVVRTVLDAREQELTRLSAHYFLKRDVWAQDQRVFVFAGKDRDETKQAHEKYRDKILV
jgi:desulfoferrodoxin (superoxide reductase-like protein)